MTSYQDPKHGTINVLVKFGPLKEASQALGIDLTMPNDGETSILERLRSDLLVMDILAFITADQYKAKGTDAEAAIKDFDGETMNAARLAFFESYEHFSRARDRSGTAELIRTIREISKREESQLAELAKMIETEELQPKSIDSPAQSE